jgi:hypothetical protein
MKKNIINCCFFLISSISLAQSTYHIQTSDIDNFWTAYDSLEYAKTKFDSVKIIQDYYIDPATPEFKEFIRIRNFTSEEYVKNINQYPKFWKTIRVKTE